MSKLKWSTLSVIIAVGLALALPARAELKVGYRVRSLKVKDSNNNDAMIPDIGKKVISFFYTDPDVKDQNEPFRDMLKAAKLDKTYYRGMGVVNMKDTWKPNFAIRSVVRKKIAKFKSLILTDPDHIVRDKWGLGDCNEKDVVIIIGKDSKVKFLKRGKMSPAEMKKNLQLVKDLIEESKKAK
jgi:predicted transcriptional regulator